MTSTARAAANEWLPAIFRVIAARRDRLAAAFFGVLWFIAFTDIRLLDPRNVDLLGTNDPASHAMGRDFAQWDSWHWPLTRIENFLAPVGTTSVMSDANPWLVIVTKLLLPRDSGSLQFVGLWLALCFALQGYCGAKIAKRVTNDGVSRALAGALFTLSPVLAFRLGHSALCAHFVLLLLLDAALTPGDDAPTSKRILLRSALVITFVAGLHPTLFAMAIPFALIALARHVRVAGRRGIVLASCFFAGPLLVWWAFGNLSTPVQTGTVGFDFFSTNLLSLVDPLESARSAFLPPLPHGPGQYEGIAYLGAGILALLVVVLVQKIRTRSHTADRFVVTLAVASLACAFFALSSRIMIGDYFALDLSGLYAHIPKITGAFRSPGRFVWPLHYALFSAAVLGALRLPRPRLVLAGALFLQLIDAHGSNARDIFAHTDLAEEPSAGWRLARGDYARLMTDPPDIRGGFANCVDAGDPVGSFLPLAHVAVRERLVLNGGWAARFDEAKLAAYCTDVARARTERHFDADAIYVPAPHVASFYLTDPKMTCGALAGKAVCVRKDRETSLQMLLADPRGAEVPLGENARASDVVAFGAGFGAPEQDATRTVRWTSARASLDLKSAGNSPMYLSFTASFPRVEIENRMATLRVFVDDHEIDRISLRNETNNGVYRLEHPNATTKVRFEADGLLVQARGNILATHVYKLVRVEWFAAGAH